MELILILIIILMISYFNKHKHRLMAQGMHILSKLVVLIGIIVFLREFFTHFF